MRDPKTHVVVYSGHASYGRNVVGALKAGTPHIGAKAFFGLHCGGGKGVHNSLRAQYPDLHVVQSKNSSYEHQDRTTLLNALKGFARRADWNDISKENRRTNSDNYYYPTDTLFRKTAEDLDGDGTIDLWDRVVSYNTFRPKADVREQLTAKDPGRPIAELDGRAFSGAVQRFVRIAGYNQWAQPLENHGILARGYFDGKLDDPIFKRADLGDGRVQLQLNKHFAHASEETLGAVMHYQLGRDATRAAGQNEVNAKLSGLLMAAKCLNVDDGALDREIWSELIAREGLPPGISLADVFATSKEDDHMLAGSQQTVESLARKLEARGVRL